MALADKLDGVTANAFKMTIDGIEIPSIEEISGLKLEVDKIELKQQTSDGKYVVRQLPGRQKAGEFTVTRALTDNTAITGWLKTVAMGDVAGARKTASVELLDTMGNTIKTYEFMNTWLKSAEVPTLKAGDTSTAKEKFTVCFDEFVVR